MWVPNHYVFGVSWWQKCEFDSLKNSYGRSSQVEFGLNGQNEEWINNDHGVIKTTPTSS